MFQSSSPSPLSPVLKKASRMTDRRKTGLATMNITTTRRLVETILPALVRISTERSLSNDVAETSPEQDCHRCHIIRTTSAQQKPITLKTATPPEWQPAASRVANIAQNQYPNKLTGARPKPMTSQNPPDWQQSGLLKLITSSVVKENCQCYTSDARANNNTTELPSESAITPIANKCR